MYVPDWNSVVIESSVVPTRPPVTRCLLGHHMERECPWSEGRMDNTQLQYMVKVMFCSLELVGCQILRTG